MAKRRTIPADVVARRHLVPTARLREIGGDPMPVFESVAEHRAVEPARASIAQRLMELLRAADPRVIEGSKLPLIVLGLTGMILTWDLAALPVLLFEMRTDFGFDLAFLATLGSVVGGIGVVASPVMGYVADRVNRVWMLRIAAILALVAAAGTAASTNLAQLIVIRALAGIALVVGGGAAAFPLLCDWYPSRQRARVFAALDVGGRIGSIFAPILTGVLAELYGWRMAMVSFGVISFAATVTAFMVREPARGYLDRLEAGESPEAAAVERRPLGWSESWRSARSVVTLRRIWYSVPFLYVGGAGALFVLTLYFKDLFHIGAGSLGVITAVGGVAQLIGVVLTAPYMDRLLQQRPARVMTYAAALPVVQAAIFLVLAVSPSLQLSIVVSILLGVLGSIVGVASLALMSLVTPGRLRGLGLQIGTLWRLPALILLPVMLTALQDWSLRQTMLAFIPLLVIGGAILAPAAAGVAIDMRAARAAALAGDYVARAAREQMLVVRDVDVTYDGTQVLFGVSCDVEAGEIIVLLGTNGAGKSTLLRAIVGIQEASNGAIVVAGEDVTHAPPHENARRGIVMVPGGHAVFPTLTVAENLNTAARATGLGADEARRRIDDVLELFPALRARLGQNAGNLSGGEQQMVALGQAFLSKPRLLMIDELSLGLAPSVVDQLVRTVKAIHEQGTTIILVEQSLNVALTIAERAIFMEKGEIRFDGAVADLMRRPDLVRAVFMGGALGGAGGGLRRAAAQTRDAIIRAEGIRVRFGGVEAVRGADIEAAAGEIVGIIGPNGAGKTTLFDVLAGAVQPVEGRVWINGADLTNASPHARALGGLGRSFQDARLFGSLTVRECIALAMERRIRVHNPLLAAVWSPNARADERRIQRRVDGLIRTLGLTAYAEKFVHELSTGTRRAVDIACIIGSEPAAVLLDEPSSGLAQAESEALAPLLTNLVRDTGCAMIVIEHDLPLIASIADRLVAMDLGTTIATGTPDEVLSDPRVVSSYLAATEDVIRRSDLQTLTPPTVHR